MHTPRRSVAAVALAATAALAVPTALAAPATGAAPAAVDTVSPAMLDQIEAFAHEPGMPDEVGSTLLGVVSFLRGDTSGDAATKADIELPVNGPAFTQFGWPTLATECVGGTSNAIGTAIAVPGPAPLPLPGVPAQQTGFVFTAMGTGPAAQKQETAMTVHWLNISTGKMGQIPLLPGTLNLTGPGTVNGVADTGSGQIVAVISGGITTEEDNGPANCEFAPTVGLTTVD